MNIEAHTNINHFWVVGINYKKSDAAIRGRFAINSDQYSAILSIAGFNGIHELFVLSTCNRTEIYGIAESSEQFLELIASQSDVKEILSDLVYTKCGYDAINHLFQVAAGLDSQILGDYEILGQIKVAVKFAKEKGYVGAFMERLINAVLQSSKAVKTHTALSGGTVSVSFAAIQYIKEQVQAVADKKILLLGTGKIGRIACKNVVDYLGTKDITLVNRTEEKAKELANDLGLQFAPLENLQEEITRADIILVATNATAPTIQKYHLENTGDKLILDLSVPCNVAADAASLENVTVVDVDQLSKIKDETLQKRQAEVPKAITIIEEHIQEFLGWHDMRKYVPVLKAVKSKLHHLHHNTPIQSKGTITIYKQDPEEKIQKVINLLAIKMRSKNTLGCQYIEAINEFIA